MTEKKFILIKDSIPTVQEFYTKRDLDKYINDYLANYCSTQALLLTKGQHTKQIVKNHKRYTFTIYTEVYLYKNCSPVFVYIETEDDLDIEDIYDQLRINVIRAQKAPEISRRVKELMDWLVDNHWSISYIFDDNCEDELIFNKGATRVVIVGEEREFSVWNSDIGVSDQCKYIQDAINDIDGFWRDIVAEFVVEKTAYTCI